MKMKRLTGAIVIAILVMFAGHEAIAQNLKFGHINSEELIQLMPEFDAATKQLETFRNDLVNALEMMSVDFNNKNNTYQKELKTYTDIVRQAKEQELLDMDRRIREFQTNAQGQLQDKQTELFQPVYAKLEKAIKDVGKENGFIYIFEVNGLRYFDATKSTDVLALTKAKLGIK